MNNDELIAACMDLDGKLKFAERLKREIEALQEALEGELRRRRVDIYEFLPGAKQVVRDEPLTETIDLDTWRRRVVAELGLSAAEAEEAVTAKVSIAKARRVAGAAFVSRIAKRKQGKPRIRITGVRGRKSS